jgi:hypothetical protein
MEIHHHTKNPDGRKENKWSHRFWEFFMLFLAITLGFFVENQREHYIEHRREIKYMKMLIDDLTADKKEIERVDISRKKREILIDSLFQLLTSNPGGATIPAIYRLTLNTDGYESFLRNDRTIQEMKSSGGMRTVRNKTVSGAIMEYDNFIVAEVDWNNKTEAARIDYYKQIRFQFLNAKNLHDAAYGKPTGKFIVMSSGAVYLNSITGALFQVKRISETCRESGITAKSKAENLIALIEKEYHLK